LLELDENQNQVDINQEVNGYFSNVVGVGLDFALNPPRPDWDQMKTTYIIYLETFYTRIPKITDVSENRFQLVSVNIGVKTTF